MEPESKMETFDPDLIHAIFKLVWSKKALERERIGGLENLNNEVEPSTSKKNRPTSANSNALKLSCELLRTFVVVCPQCSLPRGLEAVERAAAIAEAEGVHKIEATHLERILPQLLLDF
ncbi:Mhf2-like protein [Thalictrum thalictroides]|uniref:Mhf2-like protein n=1 Tax=Thalictrum thalictroides TaxID=46969 RepID=A0A7J6UZ52_THATH|nr:Mhf2-like protein [Thalictrum thalictroides]